MKSCIYVNQSLQVVCVCVFMKANISFYAVRAEATVAIRMSSISVTLLYSFRVLCFKDISKP